MAKFTRWLVCFLVGHNWLYNSEIIKDGGKRVCRRCHNSETAYIVDDKEIWLDY